MGREPTQLERRQQLHQSETLIIMLALSLSRLVRAKPRMDSSLIDLAGEQQA